MDDIAEIGTAIWDNLRDFNAHRLVVRGREIIRSSVLKGMLEGIGGEKAKKANKVIVSIKVGDIVIDQLGIDPNNEIRSRIGRYTGSIHAGDLLPPDDQAEGGAVASDEGARPPAADRMLTGVIDP